MNRTWTIRNYVFSSYHILDLHAYVYKRVSKPGYGLRITYYNLQNVSNETIYVGNESHATATALIAKGYALSSKMELSVSEQSVVTVFPVSRVGKINLVIGYEFVSMNLEGLGNTLDKVTWNPDDLRGKPVFPCHCVFYEVILKSGCQCGGT